MEEKELEEELLQEPDQEERDTLAVRLILLLVALGVAAILYGVFGRQGSVVIFQKDQPAVRSSDQVLVEHSIPLNTADTYQLQLLPDIGPELAGRIIAYRESHGPFTDLNQLLEVEGIGPITLGRIRDYLTLEAPDASSKQP